MRSLFFMSIKVLVAGLLLFTMAGCSDDGNPADSGENENHLESVGVRILDTDSTVVAEADGTDVSGSITLSNGAVSAFYTVHFLDPDSGEWYDPEEREAEHVEGEEHSHELVATLTDDALATVTMGEEIADAPTHWGFQLEGVATGETTFRVEIYHEDHPDYTSPLIPLVVE